MKLYQIGVVLSMSGNANQFLQTIARDLVGVHNGVTQATAGLARFKVALAGAAAIGVGSAALVGMKHIVEHGNELVRVQQNMAIAGASATQVQEAFNKSLEMTARHKNMGLSEVMHMINDARGIFGDQHTATEHVDDIVKSGSFLKAFMGGEKGADAHKSLLQEMNAALKSGEIAGKITPSEMTKHIEMLTAMKVAFGNQLKISQYLTAQRTAGVALRNTSDEFRYGMFPALVQENGVNAGTMLMTAFNKVVAGVGNRTQSLQKMQSLGLLNEENIKYDKVGRAIGLKGFGGILGSDEAAFNFGDWVMKTLKPHIDKEKALKGLDPNSKEYAIKQSQIISALFPDRNAAKAITEIIQQYTKFQKDAELIKMAWSKLTGKGSEQYVDKSYEGQKQAFHTQWKNTLELLGAPLVGVATDALRSLNSALSSMTQWAAKADPATIKLIGAALTGLAAGIAALGVVLIGSAVAAAIGAGGWLVVGIAALGAAVTAAYVAFKDFDFNKFIGPINDAMTSITNSFESAIKAIPGKVTGAINSMASAIGLAISGAISGIGDWIRGKLNIRGTGTPAAPAAPGAPFKQGSYQGPTVAGASKQASLGDVYLDGDKVGRHVARNVARQSLFTAGVAGYDTDLHPAYAAG